MDPVVITRFQRAWGGDDDDLQWRRWWWWWCISPRKLLVAIEGTDVVKAPGRLDMTMYCGKLSGAPDTDIRVGIDPGEAAKTIVGLTVDDELFGGHRPLLAGVGAV